MDDYYEKLARDAATFALGCKPGDWYDFWHTHVDWDGRGNSGPADRQKHLAALFIVWERVRGEAQRLEAPFQTWVRVEEDSAQDGVYLHTPNVQQEDFPFGFEEVVWGVQVPSLLAEFVDDSDEVGRSEYEGVATLWVRKRAVTG